MRTKKRASVHISSKKARKRAGRDIKRVAKKVTRALAHALARAREQDEPELYRGKKLVRSEWTDSDDAPAWTREQIEEADLYHGDKLVRAGRPPSAHPKVPLKLRIDPDVVERFRESGPGWQTRMNDALRRAAKLPVRR